MPTVWIEGMGDDPQRARIARQATDDVAGVIVWRPGYRVHRSCGLAGEIWPPLEIRVGEGLAIVVRSPPPYGVVQPGIMR